MVVIAQWDLLFLSMFAWVPSEVHSFLSMLKLTNTKHFSFGCSFSVNTTYCLTLYVANWLCPAGNPGLLSSNVKLVGN